MKILIIDNGAINEINNTYCTNTLNGLFLNELAAYGHKLSYCQFITKTENSISVFDLQEAGVKCYPLKIFKSKILRYIVAYFKILFIILNHDFIHIYYPNPFKYIAFICKAFHKQYGIYIRGMQGVDSKYSNLIYKNAKVVLTVSDYFTDMVNTVVESNIAYTICPMISYTSRDLVMHRKYIAKEKYKVLYLGRMDAEKGLNELLQAVNIIKEKGQVEFKLELVGDGSFTPQLKQLVHDLNISDVTNFNGAIYDNNEKRKCYEQADIYILPTHHEGFPRTLYEAMIFGTPIITTFVGGIPSVMRNNFNCLEIKPKSVSSIVDVLNGALSNYLEIGVLAKNASQTVSEILKRESHAKLLDKCLKSSMI